MLLVSRVPKSKPQPKPVHLNEEQCAVVESRDGFFNVVAGPGSGKSESIIRRFVHLLDTGVAAEDILSLTFTNSAAKQMRERAEAARSIPPSLAPAGFCTFHSLALNFCTREREHFPFSLAEFPLATEPQSNKFVYEAARRFEVDPRTLRPWISLQKRNRIRPAEALRTAERDGQNEKLALAYKMAENSMREAGVLDFDSLLLEMVDLLESREDVLARWSYRYLQADEAQDNSVLEWRLLQLLSRRHGNLLAVGDCGQGIYGFRGASGDLFLNFKEMFPNATTLYLARNHRSSPQIVDFCRTAGPVPELAARFHTLNPDGPEPVITGYPSAADEAQGLLAADPAEGTAVLARTNRALRPFEDALSVAGVRYHLLGGCGFWQQEEIRSACAFLQCAIAPHDGAVMAALRSPFHVTRFLRKKEIADQVKAIQKHAPAKLSVWRLLNEYQSTDAQQTKALGTFVHFMHTLVRYRESQIPTQQIVASLVQELRAFDYYAEHASVDNAPAENLQELIKISARFSSLRDFSGYIRRVSAASKVKKGVCLSTIHAAKGREWTRVFVGAVQEGILPHARATDLSEERNCFFVAVSRACRELRISYTGEPSRFLLPFLKGKE